MRRVLALLATLLSIAACAAPTEPGDVLVPLLSASVTHDRVTVPLEALPVVNECTGETIIVDGEFTTMIHAVIDGRGATHLSIHQHAKASGVSDAGVKYNLMLVTHASQLDFGAGEAMVFTVPFTLKYVGQGPGNNFFLRSLVHITRHDDGTNSAYLDRTTFGCQ